MMSMKVRWAFWTMAGLLLCAQAQAQAQGQAQSPIRNVGVFSLLGDSVQVASATDAPRDTRIERTARETMEFKDIGFDIIAGGVARKAIETRQPPTLFRVFRAPVLLTLDDQVLIADGAKRGELPDWMVRSIVTHKFTHVLLITRARGQTKIRTDEGDSIGRGTVEGIGFYLDTLYQLKNDKTGAISNGLIAPYAEMRVTLMDTDTAQVVAEHRLSEAYALASADNQVVADPWNFLSAIEKVQVLREMVEKTLARGIAAVLPKTAP